MYALYIIPTTIDAGIRKQIRWIRNLERRWIIQLPSDFSVHTSMHSNASLPSLLSSYSFLITKFHYWSSMAGGATAAAGNVDIRYRHLLHPGAWWKNPRLIRLNCCILLLLITSSTNGYDGSMMNGLQTLPQWQSAFNNPQGGKVCPSLSYQTSYWSCIQTI